MDPVRATHAAARHLRELHRDFRGDWALAAAAYNAGGGRISRGLNRFGARDFWDLAERGDLAQETRHYVPRLYAVTIIAKDPERFGYPARAAGARGFAYDSIRVDVATPLTELAALGGFPLADLVDLNPHLVRQVAPAQYWVWVPSGNGAALQQAFNGSEFRRRGGFGVYTVRRGDDLASIAFAAAMPEDRVRQMNLGVGFSRLGPGDRLRLPADAARALNARPRPSARLASADAREEKPAESAPAATAPEQRADYAQGLVRSVPRETRRASPSEPEERKASGDGDADASAGERRSTRTAARENRDGDERLARRTASRNSRSEDEETPSRTRRAREEPRPSGRRTEARTHTVDGGETLWGIARRYDLTVAQVRQANDLGEDEALQPGQKLRIPRASRTASPERSPRARAAEHVVRSGETLWSIARRYESSVEAIRGANDLDADQALQPGQKLRIPRSSGDQE
jgi:membrane-bound lytic murein transglycosylase D